MNNIPITIQDLEDGMFHGEIKLASSNAKVTATNYGPTLINVGPPMTLNPNRHWAMEVLQHIYNNNGKCLQGNGVECECPCEAFYKMNECKRGLFIKSNDRRD